MIKKNNTNLYSVTWYEVYQKSKNLAKDLPIESTMIWGCQWDATMQWILQSSNPDIVKYVRDSSGQGCYNQSLATSTGQYKVNNIYDMAGNCYEWTLEANYTNSRVLRRRQLR